MINPVFMPDKDLSSVPVLKATNVGFGNCHPSPVWHVENRTQRGFLLPLNLDNQTPSVAVFFHYNRTRVFRQVQLSFVLWWDWPGSNRRPEV